MNTPAQSSGIPARSPTLGSLLWLLVALAVLNAMLTFHNVWPTPLIRWPGELSIELIALLLGVAAWTHWRGPLPRTLIATLALLLLFGTLARYAEVTAPALYGREVNLYWDLRHATSLAGMLGNVVPGWLIAIGAGMIALALILLYVLASACWRHIGNAMQHPRTRMTLTLVCVLSVAWFAAQRLAPSIQQPPRFSIPVAATYGEQLGRLTLALRERHRPASLPPSPALASTLARTEGRDVIVMFMESYGRVAYERDEFRSALQDARQELDAALNETGRGIASAFVESPTFGGNSWLAHLSFLTGIEVRDPGRAQLLMTQQRRTLGDVFAERGYRRVALMPGLKWHWPEGDFYRFDALYDDAGLGYDGPAFGWWRIPDQFALARLNAWERPSQQLEPRAPVFAFFPTTSTHAPFHPTPPYQSDWQRLLGRQPFDSAQVEERTAEKPRWQDMSAGYGEAVDYAMRTLAGYLRQQSDDFLLIVLGDHQPPAMVSGAQASWDVPVHIITRDTALLEQLRGQGFGADIIPPEKTLSRMHELTPMLLTALEGDEPASDSSGAD